MCSGSYNVRYFCPATFPNQIQIYEISRRAYYITPLMIILNYVIYVIMSCHFPKQHEDEGKFDMTYLLTSIFPILSKDMFLLIICHVCHNKMWQQIYWTLADSTVSYLFSLNIHLDNFDLGLIHSAFQCLLT